MPSTQAQSGIVTETIPNLVGGVSQQPAAVRHPTQAQEIINAFPSLTEGLKRRPPTNYLADLTSVVSASADCFAHIYNRDITERYLILIVNGNLAVYSLTDGSPKTVTFPDGRAYLNSSSPSTDFRAQTVGDYTFIANRTVTVQQLSTLSPAPTFEALVWIRIGDYGVTYVLTLDGVSYKFNSDLTHRDEVTTDFIAKALLAQIPNGKTVSTVFFGGAYAVGQTVTVTTSSGAGETDVYTIKAGADGEVESKHDIARGLAAVINANALASGNHIFAFAIGDALVISGITSADNYSWSVSTSGSGTPSVTNTSQSNTYLATLNGSTLYIKREDDADFTVETHDGLGDQSIRAIKGTIQRFEDLPARGVNGFRIEVKREQSATATVNSFFVEYVDSGNVHNDGVWRESLKGGEKIALDPATMPWILIRNGDGTFTFRQATWTNRLVGSVDGDGVFPSFTGSAINEVFFWKNRLGLASGENIILTPVGDYFNFFRKSVMQVLDDELIDIAEANVQVAIIRHVTPHEKDAILWGDQQQFVLQGQPLLTPKTIAAPPLVAFDCSERVKPAAVGKDVFFCSERDGATKVLELYRDNESSDADDITTDVPSYITGTPKWISGSTNMDMVAVGTISGNNQLYLYKFLWNGNKPLQSAWHMWKFGDVGGNILAGKFLENKLYLVNQRGSSVFLEVIKITPGDADAYTDHLTYLDLRVTNETPGVAIDYSIGLTTWTLPFNLPIDSANPARVVRRATGSSTDTTEILNVTRPAANKVAAAGDYRTTPVWIGLSFVTEFDFSTLYTRDQDGTAVAEARTDVRFLELKYAKAGFFQAQVTPNGRSAPYTYAFDAGPNVNNAAGTLHIPVQAQNDKVSIKLITSDPRPCTFEGVTWTALVSQRTRRLV